MPLFYKKHFIFIETILAIIVSAVAAYMSIKYGLITMPTNDFFFMIIESLVGLLGFIIAISAILFALEDGKKLDHFKKSTQYKKVMEIYINAIKWISISALSLIAVQMVAIPIEDQYIVFLGIFAIVITVLKVWRCVWITNELFQLSTNINDE